MQKTAEITFVTDRIGITNFVLAFDHAALSAVGISSEAILCLDTKASDRYPRDARTVINLVDGENPQDLFQRAVDILAALLKRHERVLVHCHAGKSRSVAIVAAYLVRYGGVEHEEALHTVLSKRTCANVMPGLLKNIFKIQVRAAGKA